MMKVLTEGSHPHQWALTLPEWTPWLLSGPLIAAYSWTLTSLNSMVVSHVLPPLMQEEARNKAVRVERQAPKHLLMGLRLLQPLPRC